MQEGAKEEKEDWHQKKSESVQARRSKKEIMAGQALQTIAALSNTAFKYLPN